MNTTLKSILVSLVCAASALAASASFAHEPVRGDRDQFTRAAPFAPQRWQHEIDARQRAQADRIDDARRHGELTRHEYRRLVEQQQDIRRMEHAFLADGRLDRHEYERLDAALDRASRSIRREANDSAQAERRFPRPHAYN